MIVFSEIKRCQNPQFTQIVQKARKKTWKGRPVLDVEGRHERLVVEALDNEVEEPRRRDFIDARTAPFRVGGGHFVSLPLDLASATKKS